MAQFRQSGFDRVSVRNGGASDHLSIGIRAAPHTNKQSRINRRLRPRKISIGTLILILLSVAFLASVSAFLYLSRDKEVNGNKAQGDDLGNDPDFLTNVTRTQTDKVLQFGHGSVANGRDSRYWDRDDRRRDNDYTEDAVERASTSTQLGSTDKVHVPAKGRNSDKRSSVGLYNEAGRDELKMYEAEYEASLRSGGKSESKDSNKNWLSKDAVLGTRRDDVDVDDEYDDVIDVNDPRMEDYDDAGHGNTDHSDVAKSHSIDGSGSGEAEEASSDLSEEDSSLNSLTTDKVNAKSRHVSVIDSKSARRSTSERRTVPKKKPKRRNAQLVEPLENPKFARFSLQYTEVDEKPNNGVEPWQPRFAGHQSLKQREDSYTARDQKINCGFVKGPKGSPSTGFDLAEDDSKYISSCHIAVVSCIFGNSDRLRTPMGKTLFFEIFLPSEKVQWQLSA
ncbi:hypothetical protein RJ640_003413 [Escallonia rubra]|uniref:TOD1/MUCI70 glycosyltransferase-like domain-containing protein n=1 Tax=Escallonia rubra TaxID=112253 RepID=A0AA88RS08_9ASTE|nr:hypothetical protein RJ640_003413 [Escallonia rubra]